jgi:cellulose synthase/poly-beta-1,6-N-acetylglucosamine synthase-like glycosyltransferase
MRLSDWLVGVVVPARDEEEHISECLAAIQASLDGASGVTASWIVVVADSCRDRTAIRARAALGMTGEVLECGVRSPGTARRLGVEAVLRRYPTADSSRLWIANTDADSRPGADWIHQQLRFASQGFAGVAGVVHVDSIDGLGSEDVAALLEHYVVNEDGSHPHVHGANLGVRGDAYVDAGGWGDLALAEDHCLWSRMKARNWRTISSTSSVVVTSGRLVGRAAGGFADSLRRRLELRYA